jgi:3-hydroxyacyl-[acyl-carrier-protein] dehydratase
MEECLVADFQTAKKILELIPQRPPFRFIDDILAIEDGKIIAVYQFRENEYFYKGHFPGNPITPGVILIEAMAQTGVVALGISLLLHEGSAMDELKKMTTLFAFAEHIEFSGIVHPGEKVIMQGEKIYFRKGVLKSKVSMMRENGDIVCIGLLTGTGVLTK